jgi:hypothetical protein
MSYSIFLFKTKTIFKLNFLIKIFKKSIPGSFRIRRLASEGGQSSGPTGIFQTGLFRIHNRKPRIRQNGGNVAEVAHLPDDDDPDHLFTGNSYGQNLLFPVTYVYTGVYFRILRTVQTLQKYGDL